MDGLIPNKQRKQRQQAFSAGHSWGSFTTWNIHTPQFQCYRLVGVASDLPISFY
jgi:hypothetical protein